MSSEPQVSGKAGQVALDQSRAVSLVRLTRKPGSVSAKAAAEIATVLGEMIQP